MGSCTGKPVPSRKIVGGGVYGQIAAAFTQVGLWRLQGLNGILPRRFHPFVAC